MASVLARLCRGETPATVLARFDDDDASKPEQAQDRYDAYQAFLSNILLVSTLLLGFILTGTMLSVGLTGDENYTLIELMTFSNKVAKAGGFSLMSSVLAFATQARGADAFTRRGPAAGLRALKRSLVLMLFSELLLYLSVVYFTSSLWNYTGMTYMGPRICPHPVDREGAKKTFRSSLCGSLGQDFHSFATEHCSALQQGELCRYLREQHAEDVEFGWHIIGSDNRDEFETVTAELAGGVCRAGRAEALLQAACSQAAPGRQLADPARQQACAASISAWHAANQCADGKLEDAEKCRKVCQRVAGNLPYNFRRNIGVFLFVTIAAILFFVVPRILSASLKTLAFTYDHIRVHGLWASLCRQLDFGNVGDDAVDPCEPKGPSLAVPEDDLEQSSGTSQTSPCPPLFEDAGNPQTQVDAGNPPTELEAGSTRTQLDAGPSMPKTDANVNTLLKGNSI